MDNTFFNLPNQPEEFGVALPPADLRRIDFSALEFDTMRNALIEYIRTYYPDQFNDFVSNNGIIMVLELVSYVGSILSMRSDVLAEEAFLPTAHSVDAVAGHLELIGQEFKRATPATIEVVCTVALPGASEVTIPSGLLFSFSGPDNKTVYYEIYRAPNDWTSSILIPPGKRGVVAWGVEGRFGTPIEMVSSGGENQTINIDDPDALDEPIMVNIGTGDSVVEWSRVRFLDQANPQDEVYEVNQFDEGLVIRFGDNIAGKAPLAGQSVVVTYRSGGGQRGRITSGVINETRTITPLEANRASLEVLFQNVQSSQGGTDAETIEVAKTRAPREAATQNRAVTGEDYAHLAKTYSHPVYGAVFKAVTVIKTSINANVVELYLLALGAENTPVTPSVGLKDGIIQFFDEINPVTDRIEALDGAIKAVDIEMDVIISKGADAGTVKEQVLAAIDDFFNPNNWDMGQPLYISQFVNAMQVVDGVLYVKIFDPSDDILPSKVEAVPGSKGIGFNEMITLGSKSVSFYLEPGVSSVDKAP